MFLPRLIQARNDQGPLSHKIGHDVNEFWQGNTATYNGFFSAGREAINLRPTAPLSLLHQ